MNGAPGLAVQPWLSDPATVRVMTALEAAGGPDCARFVGGCVRNTLVGQDVDDIETSLGLERQRQPLGVCDDSGGCGQSLGDGLSAPFVVSGSCRAWARCTS